MLVGSLEKKTLETLETKAELQAEQNKIVHLQTFDSSSFCGKCYFENDENQNYLVFQPI